MHMHMHMHMPPASGRSAGSSDRPSFKTAGSFDSKRERGGHISRHSSAQRFSRQASARSLRGAELSADEYGAERSRRLVYAAVVHAGRHRQHMGGASPVQTARGWGRRARTPLDAAARGLACTAQHGGHGASGRGLFMHRRYAAPALHLMALQLLVAACVEQDKKKGWFG